MQDPGFQTLVNNYQQYLMQQMVQEQNKLTGRLGVSPTQDGLQKRGADADGEIAVSCQRSSQSAGPKT